MAQTGEKQQTPEKRETALSDSWQRDLVFQERRFQALNHREKKFCATKARGGAFALRAQQAAPLRDNGKAPVRRLRACATAAKS
jgi:hypothetical protein